MTMNYIKSRKYRSQNALAQSIVAVAVAIADCKAYQCECSRCNYNPLPMLSLQQKIQQIAQQQEIAKIIKINANMYCNPLGARNIMKRKCYCGSYSHSRGKDGLDSLAPNAQCGVHSRSHSPSVPLPPTKCHLPSLDGFPNKENK